MVFYRNRIPVVWIMSTFEFFEVWISPSDLGSRTLELTILRYGMLLLESISKYWAIITKTNHRDLRAGPSCWRPELSPKTRYIPVQCFDPTSVTWADYESKVGQGQDGGDWLEMSDCVSFITTPQLFPEWSRVSLGTHLKFAFFAPLAQPFPGILPEVVIPVTLCLMSTNWTTDKPLQSSVEVS